MNHYLDHAAGRTFETEEGEFLYFGGTSYLGLQTHPEFLKALQDNIDKYGSNFGASRKANVRISVFEKFEKFMAEKSQAPAAVSFSSGYLAGLALSIYFDRPGYRKFYAPNSHSAMHNNHEQNYNSFNELAVELSACLQEKKNQPVILFDTIDFSGINYPDFEALQKLPLSECIIIADHSHGFGLSNNGFGMFQHLKSCKPKELILCGSLGKALATTCGIVLGEAERIHKIKETSIFGGASPASPAALQNLMDQKGLVEKQLKKLRENILEFENGLSPAFHCTKMRDIPVYSYYDEGLTKFLKKNRIITTSFRYPNEEAELINKIVISASHKTKDIQLLQSLINKFYTTDIS